MKLWELTVERFNKISEYVLIFVISFFLFGFTAPQIQTVTKPTPNTTKTICASGCDYATIEAADAAYSGLTPPVLFQIKAGDYEGDFDWDSDGTSGNEIVFEPFGDGAVYIETTDATKNNRIDGDFIIIDGGSDKDIYFRRDSAATATDDHRTLVIYGSNVTVYRTQFTGSTGNDSLTNNAKLMILDASTCAVPSNVKIYNNYFNGTTHKGVYIHGCTTCEISGNEFDSVTGNVVQFNPRNGKDVFGMTMDGNVFYTTANDMIHISGLSSMSCDATNSEFRDILITNNLFWDHNSVSATGAMINMSFSFDCPLDTGDAGYEIRIFNNTLYDGDTHGIRFVTSQMDNCTNELDITNNLFRTIDGNPLQPTGSYSGYTDLTNFKDTADPNFVSITSSNDNYLKLSSTTPVTIVDNGTDLSGTFANDYFGQTRDSNFDIGAHEYTTAVNIRGKTKLQGGTIQ